MSCFETSTFVQNREVADPQFIRIACERLGWTIQETRSALQIFPPNTAHLSYREPVITIQNNRVTYNTYYFNNIRSQVNQLRQASETAFTEHQEEIRRQENALRVQYAYEGILTFFKKAGFNKLPVRGFTATPELPHKFYMKGRSKTESEPAQILFQISEDGTVTTDSDYIPADLHTKADEAMAKLEKLLGTKRVIQGKPIPAKYKHKAFCHQKNQIQQR